MACHVHCNPVTFCGHGKPCPYKMHFGTFENALKISKMQPPIPPPHAAPIQKGCSHCGAPKEGNVCSQCGAVLISPRRSRGWFVASVILGVAGGVMASIGQWMFYWKSIGVQSSVEAVSAAGGWAAMGFFGGFLLIVTVPVFLWTLILWLQDKRNSTKP